MKTKTEKGWIERWGHKLKKTGNKNVWALRGGGHLIRGRVVNPANGKMVNVKRVLRKQSYEEALSTWLRLRMETKTGHAKKPIANVRFATFAEDLFEKKSKPVSGDYRSPAGRNKVAGHLKHLIMGTPFPTPKNPNPKVRVPGLGETFIHMLEEPISKWRDNVAELIADGTYEPSTVNGWISTLRVYTYCSCKCDRIRSHLQEQ